MKTTISTQARQYIKPEFQMILIDNDISLVMATGEGNGDIPNGPEFDNRENEDKNDKEAFESPFKD